MWECMQAGPYPSTTGRDRAMASSEKTGLSRVSGGSPHYLVWETVTTYNLLRSPYSRMGIDTLVVAIGDDTKPQIDAITQTILDIAESTDIQVIIAHVLRGRRDTALSDLGEASQTPLERRFTEQLPANPGSEDDVPEWVRRWSQRRIRGEQDQDRDELSQSEVLDRVVARKDALQQLVNALDTVGIEFELRGATGDPVEHIGRMVEEVDADFVVVSSQGQSSIRETLFGSLAQKLLRTAPCPVIVVRHDIAE